MRGICSSISTDNVHSNVDDILEVLVFCRRDFRIPTLRCRNHLLIAIFLFLVNFTMKVKYFHDTATALIEFSVHTVAETKEINENIYIDLDANGNLVAITIEHADLHANLPDLFYEQVEAPESQPLLQEQT